jgi:diaminopimelate decarboxylase
MDTLGFNYENGEAYRSIPAPAHGKMMNLRGLHTHIGTFILDANAYYWAAKALLELASRIEKDKWHCAGIYRYGRRLCLAKHTS